MATLTRPSLADIDLTDLDRWVQGVPYDWFELLRREAPLFWQDERDGRGLLVGHALRGRDRRCRRTGRRSRAPAAAPR